MTSGELHDMAAVLDRSAGAGDKSLQEVSLFTKIRAFMSLKGVFAFEMFGTLTTI